MTTANLTRLRFPASPLSVTTEITRNGHIVGYVYRCPYGVHYGYFRKRCGENSWISARSENSVLAQADKM